MSGISSPITLRERYARELRQLDIDCYSIFTQDKWHPFAYIPHEIDSQVFYPEAVNAAPIGLCEHLSKIAVGATKDDDIHLSDGILAIPFENVSDLPEFELTYSPAIFGKHARLFSNFTQRERVCSAIVFVPKSPRIEGNDKPEVVIFNYRKKRNFSSLEILQATKLVQVMLAHLSTELQRREGTWNSAMLWSIRAHSRLTHAFNERLFTSGESNRQILVQHLLETLHDQIPKKRDEILLASVYLLQLEGERLMLNRYGEQVGGEGKSKLDKQNCLKAENASITICTTLTGRPHLLNYVDIEGQTSVDLSLHEYGKLVDLLPLKGLVLVPPQAKRPPRLVWHAEQGHYDLEILKQVDGIPELTFPAEKLRLRSESQYSHIFGELDSRWSRPCSEVCVPMNAGGRIIGCLNIESSRTYRFNPSSLNVLTAASAIIGAAFVHRSTLELLEKVQAVAEAFHVNPSFEREHLGLDNLADQVRMTLGANRVDIEAAGTVLAGNTSYVTIASSKDKNSKVTRNFNKLLGASGKVDSLGMIVALDTQKQLYVAYEIFREHAASTKDGSEIGLRFARSLSELELKESLGENPKGLIMGIPLRSQVSGGAKQTTDGVFWAYYDHAPFNFSSTQYGNKIRRNLYLQNAFQTAMQCRIIPITWSSRALSAARYSRAIHHGGFIDTIEKIEVLVAQARRTPETDIQKLKTAQLLAHNVCSHFNVSRMVFRFKDEIELQNAISQRTVVVRSLKNLVDECWQTTCALYGADNQELILDSDTDFSLTSNQDVLRELFILMFSNCLIYGKNPATGTRIVNVDLRKSTTGIHVVVRDQGPGFPDDVLHGGFASASILTLGSAEDHGLGVSMIRSLANVIGSEEPKMSNIDGGGSQWEFRIIDLKGTSDDQEDSSRSFCK